MQSKTVTLLTILALIIISVICQQIEAVPDLTGWQLALIGAAGDVSLLLAGVAALWLVELVRREVSR